jgi:hypothetical protein
MKLIDVLDKPEHWTKVKMARDESGREVPELHPSACCWCLVGAVSKATGIEATTEMTPTETAHFHAIADAISELFPEDAWLPIDQFNDMNCRTFADIHAVCVRADQILAEKGGES